MTDLALTLALGGDCLSDAGLLRSEPEIYGAVASEATVSRTMTALAKDADGVLGQIAKARKSARAQAWSLAGQSSPLHGISADAALIIDLDATIVISHSEKEQAAPTFKRTFGFHPLAAFLDHGPEGTGELLAVDLRPGNAGSNTAADHIAVTRQALAAVPGINSCRPGRKVMIRTDGGGGSKDFLKFLTKRGVSYSIGWTLPWVDMADIYAQATTAGAWPPALKSAEEINEGADITDLLRMGGHLKGCPENMRVIVRRERPHPGARVAQDRLDDAEGYRLTAFATNTSRNLPLHGFASNRIWLALVALAADLTAWTQLLAFTTEHARRWEPKRLRLRLFTIPASIAHPAPACSI